MYFLKKSSLTIKISLFCVQKKSSSNMFLYSESLTNRFPKLFCNKFKNYLNTMCVKSFIKNTSFFRKNRKVLRITRTTKNPIYLKFFCYNGQKFKRVLKHLLCSFLLCEFNCIRCKKSQKSKFFKTYDQHMITFTTFNLNKKISLVTLSNKTRFLQKSFWRVILRRIY